jgi:hypothetical protein
MSTFKIQLKSPNYGKVDHFTANETTTFQDLWDYVGNKVKDLDALRFQESMYHDGMEYEMNKYLLEFGMKDNSEVIILVSQPEGFGMPIVDLSATQKAQLIKIKKEGKTRLKINRGLNLKGKCQNTDCEAYNKSVAQPFGYGEFCMLTKASLFSCPMCQEKILKKEDDSEYSIYFVKCKWNLSGEYINTETKKRAKVPKADNWEVIDGNESKVYAPDEAGTKRWTKLDIEVVALDKY